MAITLMIYPVPLLKQQAHRLVIKYNRMRLLAHAGLLGWQPILLDQKPARRRKSPARRQLAESASKTSAPMALTEPDECSATET